MSSLSLSSLSLSLFDLARSLSNLMIFAKNQLLAFYNFLHCFSVFSFIDFCSLLLPLLPLLPLRDCLGTGVWGREKRKKKRWFFALWELGLSFPSPWAVLELSPASSLEATSGFLAALTSGWGQSEGKNGKLTTISMVLQFLVFFPNLLATI